MSIVRFSGYVVCSCIRLIYKVSSERLEKPGIELTTPGLEGKWLKYYITEASLKASKNATVTI